MKKLYKIFLAITVAFMIGATVIPSSTSVVYANSMKYEEVVPFRDRGVCGDMNKNSYTYKRYCLKQGTPSTVTKAQAACIRKIFGFIVALGTSWFNVASRFGEVVTQCQNV